MIGPGKISVTEPRSSHGSPWFPFYIGTPMLGDCVISLVLNRHSKDLKQRISVTGRLQLSFIQQGKDKTPLRGEGKPTPKERPQSVLASLLFNMLSSFVITFLPRSKSLFISWLWSPSAVILKPKKIKSVITLTFSPSICHEAMGLDAMILIFWMLNFQPAFSLFYFTLMKRFFSSSSLSAIKVISSAYLRLLILPSNLDSSLWFISFQYEKAKKYESHHCVQLCIGPYNFQLVFSSSFITQQQQKYIEYIHF